jgi:hypothetical protein
MKYLQNERTWWEQHITRMENIRILSTGIYYSCRKTAEKMAWTNARQDDITMNPHDT